MYYNIILSKSRKVYSDKAKMTKLDDLYQNILSVYLSLGCLLISYCIAINRIFPFPDGIHMRI